jgi:phosphohistidine phosphatase SixA
MNALIIFRQKGLSMSTSNFSKLFLLLILQVCIPIAMAADEPLPFKANPATPGLINQLREGGYVLFMRHGNTDRSRPDRAPQVDLNDCNTQRPLTDEGRKLAARLGEYIRQAKIPVGEVLSSPLCRAKESAEAAFGHYDVEVNLMYSGNMTDAEKIPVIKKTRELLSKPVPANTNRVIVAHGPNLRDAVGYYPKEEGTIVVFRPKAEKGFEYLGTIFPGQWQELLLK